MELRSGKIVDRTEMRGDSEDEFEEEELVSLEGYATGGIERRHRPSPKVIESTDTALPQQPPPPPVMDISSVRYRPTSVMTSADLTSARTRPDPQESGKLNIRLIILLAYIIVIHVIRYIIL